MLIDQDKELKEAILCLPEKERTKLLLKLISKDVVLMKQLKHKLVDGAESLEEKRKLLIKHIDARFDQLKKAIERYPNYLSPGELLMQMRDISGLVNQHVLITKDKFGEIESRLHILHRGYALKPDALTRPTKRNETLIAYIGGRMKLILAKYQSLHEDYQYDLKESMNHVLALIHESAVAPLAKELAFPKEF